MAGMPNLQLKLTPGDADLIARLCEQAYLTGLDEPDRQRASQLATYLRYRMSRLWPDYRTPQEKRWNAALAQIPEEQWKARQVKRS